MSFSFESVIRAASYAACDNPVFDDIWHRHHLARSIGYHVNYLMEVSNLMPANPLSKEQLDELAKAKAVIPELKEQIRLAKQAKINVADMETQLAQAEDRIDTLLRVYGNLPTADDLTGQ